MRRGRKKQDESHRKLSNSWTVNGFVNSGRCGPEGPIRQIRPSASIQLSTNYVVSICVLRPDTVISTHQSLTIRIVRS